MKNLFAAASYSFNNFYNNLNTQGQMVFSTIMLLIGVLCVLLLITYIVQSVQSKAKISKLKKQENINKIAVEKPVNDAEHLEETLVEVIEEEPKNDISDIAKRIENALTEENPINLTNFEEVQERTAIISIDELISKAKELELFEDEESTGINFLEKYNLEPAEVSEAVNGTMNKEISSEMKAFKVSQVISPIYGVKKEAIDNSNN